DRIIDAAHYCFGTVSTPDNNWVSMSFVDGQRDSSIENVEATVAVHSLAEGVRYYLWVRGQDEEGNEGTPVPISFYKTDLAEPTDENDNAWAGIQGLVDNGIGGELEASWLAAKDASTPLTYHVFGTYDTTVSGTPIFYYGTYDDYYETFSGDGYAPGDLMTVTLEGMDNERKMYVVVWVKDSAATPNTAEGTAPPRSATATDETAPWFAGLTIVEDTENGESLILKWKTAEDANKESTGRFITYNIYYREMSEDRTWEIMDSMQYSSTGINVSLNHEIFGLDANVAYEFIVSAVDFFGNNDTNLVFVMGTPTDQVAPVFAGLESAENYLDTNMDGIGGSVLLEWTAAPEPPTQGIKYLVYRSENMGEWNEVPIETENDFYLFEGLTNDKTYYFKVWAKDKFDNTNYNNNTENAIPTDTQVPYFVFLDEWTVEDAETGGAVTLRWSQAFDNNTDPGTSSGWHFKIYRDGSLKTTIFFNAANFTYEWTDTGLYNGVAYSYYIHCRDNSSNYAQLSTETIVPTDQEDPVFAGIDPVVCPAGTEGVLRLDWTEAVDGDTAPDAEIFYDIYRRVAGTGTWTMIDTITGDELPYEDDGSGATKQVGILEIDETYEYKVSARDNAWNDMETPFVAGTVVDTLAPRWSEDFTATDTGTGKTVKLTWIEADDVSDPVKYNIYWDTNPLFVPGLLTLKEQLVSGTPVDGLLEFEVEGLANDIVYWFILLPVDDEGNEADPVTPVDAEPTDVAPPEFDGLWLAEDLGTYGEVRLKWNDSTDNTDPVEYLVYYSSEGDPFLSDFKMSTPGTEIDIAGLENGKNYHFGVRARDSAVPQNTDNNTFFISMVPSDTIKPTFDGLVSATNEGSGGAVTLSWAAAADDSTNYSQSIYYHVYISKMDDITVQDTGDSSSLLSTTTQTTYTVEIGLDNKPLENDKKYYFLVKAVDHSGNMDVNTVMKNATPEDILPPVFSGPKAAQDQKVGGTLKLTWNTATDDYGVTYKIFRSDDPDFYGGAIANETPIAEDLTGTYYLDEELHNGQTYYYYVWVTDDNDNTNQNMNMVSATVTDDEPPSFAGLRTITDREEGGELLLTWNVAVDSSTAPGDEGKITYKIFMDDSQSVQAVPDYEVGETSALSFLSDNLANGVTYWYIVKAYDGAGNPDTSRERAVSAVPTRPNDGPSIASDIIQAQPVDMVGTTKVTFRATYSDPDGDKPKDNSVKVIIEGPDGRRQELIMTSQATSSNPDYVVGVPYQRVGFQAIPGEHTYYFECMDNPEEKSNDPGIEYVSPSETFTVFSKNAAPTLTESSMTPISGDSTTLFTFSITYKDPDDDPPARMQVLINDVPHDMILITGGTDHTKASTYSFSTTLDAESYTYFFYAEDADGNSEQTSRRTFDVEEPDSDAGGGDISNFLANEYYGVTGFVWLVLLIIIIIGILAVAAMAGKKGGPAPPPAAVKSAAQEAPETPMEETIDCPTCGSKLMISSPERPVTIECPTCNSQLKIS
ncbi:MAG: fibronectin type III domain-containing protein, partial [Thermoplasmata archaeon]|nr:fibronectin type III domain-containing protein [Thermoplasmata archaeon]